MKNFLTRVATGLVFGIVLIGSMWLGKNYFGLLFIIVTMLSVKEFCTLIAKHKKTTFSKWWAILGGGYLFAAFFAVYHLGFEHKLAVFAPYIALVVYVFIQQVFSIKGSKLDNFAYFTLSQVYAALPFAMLNMLSTVGAAEGETYNMLLPLCIFIFIWCNDTGAFCIGCTMGRHKMFERVSPKKTWEGFAGGAIVAIAAGVVLSYISDIMNVWQWTGMAAIVVATATLGDLIESCMKREMQIKDSGNILPGHGGMLDRFDSTILATPSVIAYLSLIGLI